MASNSKKRRRVLGASCILAALIIASSSFAWFTSKDEVSNRLSANADYGTKIVESFAPPKNWLPGQEVNKDVYATNTGTIGAFVREDVSGTLTVTKDIATTERTANSIKLTDEERYAVEAGAFLAYKPAESAAVLGDQVVVRPADKAGSPSATDFTPDKTGLYVFRRAIDVASSATETFEYDGYYVVKGTTANDPDEYYKISNLTYVQDATADKAGSNVRTDGNLAAASAGFWEEKTEVANPTALKYAEDPAGYTGKYLVVEYDTGNYIKESKFAAAANAYDQAIHNYEYLTALAAAATAEADAAAGNSGDGLGAKATALGNAETALGDAVDDLQDAAEDLDDAQIAKNNAVAAEAYAAQKVKEAKIALYGADNSGEPNDSGSASADSLLGKKTAADNALGSATQGDNDRFEAEIDAWFDAQKTVVGTEAKKLADGGKTAVNSSDLSVAALEEFSQWVSGHEGHDFFTKTAADKIAIKNYEDKMVELYGNKEGGENAKTATPGGAANQYTEDSLYGEWKAADANKTSTTDALGSETDTAGPSKWGLYNAAKTALAAAQADYETKYNDWYDAYLASKAATDKKNEIDEAAVAAAQAKTKAEQAMTQAESDMKAANATDGILKIYVKLADNVNTTGTAQAWQMLPANVANDTAVFYYKGILEGGETSAKLIDSVELDKNANQDMYKYFDFDLNIALKSAQITYADDNETILATATPSELDAVATLTTPKDIDTEVTWAATH